MRHILVCQNNVVRADIPSEELPAIRKDQHAVIWLDIEGEPGKYRALLADTFGLSSLTISTIGEDAERAKLAEGPGYFYLVTHGLDFDPHTDEAETPKLDIVFGVNFLITSHRASLPWLNTLRDATTHGHDDENILGRGVAHLLYAVLDTLVDSYFPVLDQLDDIVDDLENQTLVDTSNEVQARIFRLKRSLAHMRRTISPQVEVANALITRTGELIPREVEPYFTEIHDHLVRVFEVLDSYRDLMSGLLDVYLTTVSNRLNSVMKQLTIIATIFMPITFITGIFGMNFAHSPQVEHDPGYAFWLVLLAMALISAMQIWYFKRRGWL
ncbi:MAG: Magnesium and cobalt transport protein CorA [Ktedonobacterales bacterium]|nr:MAG: Magnesium and cobalt transport protein CorA [Ktedonobacterales bacterium]